MRAGLSWASPGFLPVIAVLPVVAVLPGIVFLPSLLSFPLLSSDPELPSDSGRLSTCFPPTPSLACSALHPACLPSDGHQFAPSCARRSRPAPRRSCLRLFLSVCLLFPSYPSLPAPAPAACACCRLCACPRLFAVRWSPACPFLRQSVPVSPSSRRLVAVTHVITPSASPQATRPAIRFCSSRATIFRPLRFPSLSLAPLPHLPQLAHSCLSLQPLPHLRLSAPVRPVRPGPLSTHADF